MTIFVTGGSGFLGQAVLRALDARGRAARALVRPDSDVRALDMENLATVLGDVGDLTTLRAGMAETRAVVHIATQTGNGKGREFGAVNIQGYRNVMDTAWELKIPLVVYVSCFLLLGPTAGEIADEDHISAPRRNAGEHERSKAVAEQLTSSYLSGGLPLSVVYPGLLYGPGPLRGGNLVSPLIRDAASGRLPDLPGKERLPLSFLDDVARGICRVLEVGEPGDRYFLGGDNVTFTELKSQIEASGAPAPSKGILGRLLKGKACPEYRQVAELLKDDWAYSSARAETRLGYVHRPLHEGLRLTVNHMGRKGLFR